MTPLVLALSLLSAAETSTPAPATPEQPPCNATSFFDCLVLTVGAGAFGDAYPLSSVTAADTRGPQRSLIGGLRFWLGTRWPNVVALRGVFEFGYVTVGPFPTRGSDGLMESAGLEVSLDTFTWVKPFVRFMYSVVIQRFTPFLDPEREDLLQANAFQFHAGVLVRVVEVHLSVARDFAGGVSPGIGLSLAWID